MNLRSLLCLALAVALLLGCLTGCRGGEPAEPEPGKEPRAALDEAEAAALQAAMNDDGALGFSDFDDRLIEYLKQTGKAEENFTVSPLSLKAALTLAALGAEGETRDQLLRALGFADLEALHAWYAGVLEGTDRFEEEMADADCPGAYRVVNSVWSNKDLQGKFRGSFLEDVKTACRAEADSARASRLTDAINSWVNKQTNGLIPSIVGSLSDTRALLVNALYLKSGWLTEFRSCGDGAFTTLTGETVQKPYMTQHTHMNYYEDEKTQLVSVPLWGGVSMVFVLGDCTDFAAKLHRAEERNVDLTVPLFDVETAFDRGELVDYLRLLGCEKMFTEAAEFDPMYTKPLHVGDIVQKAKVHIDEQGLEAAAATEVSFPDWAPEPATFRADRPFSFYVVTTSETPELLFWGQIVR